MATLEDKILGEKLHNYCSSSSSSDGENDTDDSQERQKRPEPAKDQPPLQTKEWEGTSTNTGPKGVMEDWRRYKQLEAERRQESERERVELAKRLTMTVKSALDEERAAQEDPELAELLDDEFLVVYQKKRMQEMLSRSKHHLKFGDLIFLKDGSEFLKAIDQEHKAVKIIVHIYEEGVDACRAMNDSLKTLSKIYNTVKFCAILSSKAGMSRDFRVSGVPALLIYKGGQLLGNFVRLSDDLGSDFEAEDVQGYLVEHGMLEDKTCTPLLVKAGENEGDDDD